MTIHVTERQVQDKCGNILDKWMKNERTDIYIYVGRRHRGLEDTIEMEELLKMISVEVEYEKSEKKKSQESTRGSELTTEKIGESILFVARKRTSAAARREMNLEESERLLQAQEINNGNEKKEPETSFKFPVEVAATNS